MLSIDHLARIVGTVLLARSRHSTEDETKGQGAIFLNFLYVHGNCTAVI